MNTLSARCAFGLLALTAPVCAQNFLELPVTANPSAELPNYGLYPFAYTNAHVQMFFDATEVGSSTFTATSISFRYDGPLPQVGAPGPFAIQRLQIKLGTTTVAMPEARFASNLSSPLTTAFDAPVTYLPDPGSASPHPWGAPNGSLEFVFSTPVSISIPPGGWLVADIAMTNNNFFMFGFAHTILDGAATTGGPLDGTAVAFGQGCGVTATAAPATIGSAGLRAPGAAQFVTGTELGANAPVFVIYGLDNTQSLFGPLPYRLPGTNCDLLVSVDATSLAFADATGALDSRSFANALVVPADPAYANLVIHEQLAALAPGANSFAVAFSNAQTVTLGSLTPLGRGTYVVGNGSDANATLATQVLPFGYAVRLGTQ